MAHQFNPRPAGPNPNQRPRGPNQIQRDDELAFLRQKLVESEERAHTMHKVVVALKNRSLPPAEHSVILEQNQIIGNKNMILCQQNDTLSHQVGELTQKLQEGTNQYHELHRGYEALVQANETYAEKISELNTEVVREALKVSGLEEKLSTSENCVKYKVEELQKCLSKVKELEDKLTSKSSELNEKLECAMVNLQKSDESKQTLENELKNFKVALDSERKQNRKDVEELQRSFEDSRKEIEKLGECNEGLREKVHDLEKQLSSAESGNKITTEKVKLLECEKGQLDEKLVKYQGKVSELTKSLQHSAAALQKSKESNQSLQIQLENTNRVLASERKQNNENGAELQRRCKDLGKLNNSLKEKLEATNKVQQEQVRDLEEQLTSSANDMKIMTDKVKNLEWEKGQLERKNKQINDKYHEKVSEHSELNEKLELAESDLQKSQESKQTLQNELENSKLVLDSERKLNNENSAELQRRCGDLDNLNKSLKANIEQLETSNKTQQQQVRDLEEQLSLENDVKITMESLHEHLNKASSDIAKFTSMLSLKLSLDKNKGLLEQKQELESEIEQLTANYQKEFTGLKEKLDEITSELKKSKETNQTLQSKSNWLLVQRATIKFDDQYVRLSHKSNGRPVKVLLSEVQESRRQSEQNSHNSQQQPQNENRRVVFKDDRLKGSLRSKEKTKVMQSASQENEESPSATIPTVVLTRVDDVNWATSDKSSDAGDKNATTQLK